jgi:hypothetical protein
MPHVPPGQMDCVQCATMPALDLLEQVECAHTGNQAAGYQHRVLACAGPVTNITRQTMLSWQKASSHPNDILIRVRLLAVPNGTENSAADWLLYPQ